MLDEEAPPAPAAMDLELADRAAHHESKSEPGSDEEFSSDPASALVKQPGGGAGAGADAADDEDLEADGGGAGAPLHSLADEFAVGEDIAASWDADACGPDGDCDACCGDHAYDDAPGDDDACMRACNCISARVCRALGARKLGHLAVLATTTRPRDGATELACVAGPFWPFTACITFPLIIVVETFAALYLLPRHSAWLVMLWALSLSLMVGGLLGTSCRDPGVLRRTLEKPERGGGGWRWSDQARTYRPPGAQYDSDCGVVIEGFDHVCPWTGTGIGARNMNAFHTFVSCLCVCLIFDVLLLVGALEGV